MTAQHGATVLHRQRLCLKRVSIAGLCGNTVLYIMQVVLYIMQAAVSWHSNVSKASLSALRINNVTTALHSTTLMQLMCSTTAQIEAGCGLAGKNHRRPLLHNQGA
jgi:hypothetical protein